MGAFEVQETKQILAAAINRLPEREKIVLTLYYYEGLTLGQIGDVLGITESRVCQIHTKAVIQLRAQAGRAPARTGLAATRGRRPSPCGLCSLLTLVAAHPGFLSHASALILIAWPVVF